MAPSSYHFRPSLWRRVALAFLVVSLLAVAIFYELYIDHDLYMILPPGAVLVGGLVLAIPLLLWFNSQGLLAVDNLHLSAEGLAHRKGKEATSVRWGDAVSLWLNEQGRVLVVNRKDGSSLHLSLAAFSAEDAAKIEKTAKGLFEVSVRGPR